MKTIYKKLLFLFLLLPFGALAQSTLSGVVVDSKTNQPLPGVNVIVQGANSSTSTDFDGKFQVGGLKSGDKVVFSFVGYNSQTITFSGQKSVNIILEESANQLQEVVVQVGYGTVKKKDATGSVSTLTTKDFNQGSNVTAENLLNGRVAGLTVNAGGGAPGSGNQIRIRGGSSLFASNDPLIVIDGLPIDSKTNTGSTSFLASLNPNDIESFTVLKDASATAIFGSRASNGVIIITTKKGGKKLSVDYNFQYGSGKLVDKIDVFSADEYRALIQQVRPQDVDLLGTANTDWQDEIYRRTDFVDNNISVRGNLFGAVPARLSVGNTYQEGLRLTNKFNRNTVSTTLNPSFFNDHLKLRLNATYANENNRFADGVEGNAIRFNPTQPVYDAASPYGGFFEYYNTGDNSLILGGRNPVAQLLQTYDTGKSNRFFGNFELDYKFHFFPALRAVINVGFDESNGERTKFMSSEAASGPSNNNIPYGKNEFEKRMARNKLFDAYFVYTKTFGKVDFEAQAGYSYQIRQSQSFATGNINDPNLPSNFPETTIDTDNVLLSYFGRTKFSYNDTYLLTLTMRRDGSSRFPVNNRYGNFPSAAFAWKLKNVAFKDSKVISDFKLRLGYGITGQQEIDDPVARNYYLQQYTVGSGSSQYTFGAVPTPIGISNPYNPDLKWEETTTYNVGLDYGLFDDRVTGSLDVFYKQSDDLIAKVALPDGGNFSNRGFQNIGSFTSKGIEFSINADIVKNDNFKWNVNFNATKFERRIKNLAFGSDILLGDTGAGTGGTAQIHREGFTPYSFYVYKQLYDTAGNPIEGAYADLTGDGIINGDDRYIYKNPDPDAIFGFASNMNYKNFDFSFNLRASLGNRIYNAVNAGRAQYDGLQDSAVLANLPTSVLDTNFNTTADVVLSDLYIENGSFIRLDNVTLGYTFPKWLDGKSSLRLYTGVQNALLITEYSGLDPEITNDGRDNTIYPRQRTLLFGANIKF
ncbi:SusC/RagA family TonB-linked outer membrane protein [Flavobacterium mekongense]|uniref:SusC/RagA family TonB-linked outer membrane protein n=1 Tax=Flavobacterium mekongense TaxID=3379707 RepID=UPI00399A3600